MKKLFFGLTAFVLLIIGGIYGLLFTSMGNSYVAMIIENKVNEGQQDVKMKVNDFKLTTKEILFNASIDDNSTINIAGDLNIFAKSVDLNYDINIIELSKLENITKQKLNGPFSTKGSIKGDQELAVIKGISSIASSNTTYDVNLVDFKPSNILFNMKNAKIEELLNIVNQPIYASGNLDIDADIKSADINNLDGLITQKISNGILNAKLINKELEDNPKTPITFSGNTVTKLSGNMANAKVDLDSTIAKLDVSNASVNLKNSVVNSDYILFVKDMSQLETLINQKYNGSFSTSGIVNVNNGVIKINGKSDIFKSDTTYDIKVADSKPEYVNVLVNNAKIESLLNLVNQPNYANGFMNIDAKIKNADIKNLDGKVITTILESTVNNDVVNKEFEQKLKQPLVFKGNILTDLVKTQAISKVDLNTTVTNLNMEKAVFDIEKSSFVSDYLINFTDLTKLYDLTQTKMRGSAKLAGNIKQSSDNLEVDGNSKLFGGDINFNLINDNFKANIDGVEIKDLTHMLYYPEIFTSKSKIDVDYNLATKIGKIDGNLVEGKFIKNEFSDIINTFAKFDLTQEVYEKVEIKSDMKKNIINTFVDMQSKYTKIKVPSSTLDTDKNSINALIQTTITKYSFDTTVKGDLSNPTVKVDTKAFLESKYGKKLKEKTDKYKKKLQEKLKNKIDLNKLFNKAPTTKPSTNTANNGPTNRELADALRKFMQ
ncbi:MAG: hypothetical protein C0625_07750 [Arcobacter sp.]|nr:MAG: hypothetical protein C0625_07750 [Arcobacter sp.]